MSIRNLMEMLRTGDAPFYTDFGRNFYENVRWYHPIEKVMFVYKLFVELEDISLKYQMLSREAVGEPLLEPGSLEFAETAHRLFKRMRIPSDIVSGTLKNNPEGGRYYWNIIKIDDVSFHWDVFLANPRRQKILNSIGISTPFKIDKLFYNFFCVSTREISRTHTIDNAEFVGECNYELSDELIRKLATMTIQINFSKPGLMGIRSIPPVEIIGYEPLSKPLQITYQM